MLKLLRSYRLAFTLMLLLLSSVVLCSMAPVHGVWAYTVAWYLGLGALLAVSIMLCTLQRMMNEIRGRRNPRATIARVNAAFTCIVAEPPEAVERAARRFLIHGRWHIRHSPAHDQITAERGSLGLWGSVLFHLALVLIFTGIALDAGFGYRGMFALTQGETLGTGGDGMKNETYGIFHPDRPRFTIALADFEKRHRVGTALTPASRIIIAGVQDTVEGNACINKVVGYGGYSIHQGDVWGYSLGLMVTDTTGRKNLFRGFIRLASRGVQGMRRQFEDDAMLGGGLVLHAAFFPDCRMKHGVPDSPSDEPDNPAVVVGLRRNDSLLVEATLGLGQSMQRGGFLIAFPAARYWTQFELVRQPGLPCLYAGFGLCIFGLTLRFSCARKRVTVLLSETGDGTGVTFAGWSDSSRRLFDRELRAMGRRFQRILQEGTLPPHVEMRPHPCMEETDAPG